MDGLRNPYQILNLSPDAEPVVIEAAYKALIKKYHPDLWVDDPSAQARAASINHAFATLRDPARKAECDREVRASRSAAYPRFVPPAPPRSARGSWWWTGWVAAIFIGVAQFMPWESLFPAKPATRASSAPATSGPRVAATELAAAPDRATGAALIARAASADEDWLPILPGTASPEPTTSRPANAAPESRAAATVKSRRPTRRPARSAQRRKPPGASRQAAEREFLEREGYIY